MDFNLIDINAWHRKEYFNHFMSNVPCTYSMTVKLDITNAVILKRKLYPTMLHAISKAVNNHEEFRTCFDEQGRLGFYSTMTACYTVFHKSSETFSNIWTEYSEDYQSFLSSYEQDIKKFGHIEKMCAKPNQPTNTFPVSMVPWESFEGFNLNLQKGYGYLLPIFTIGKFYGENGKTLIPLAVQVHHAVCDGFHVCRLIEEIKNYFSLLTDNEF